MRSFLQRLRVVGFVESELIRRVDQRIRYTIYPSGRTPVEAEACGSRWARRCLAGWATEVTADKVRDYLAERGWRERDWQRDTTLQN